MTGFRGLGTIDPALVTQLIQTGTSLTTASIDLAKSVQDRKLAEAAAKRKRKQAEAPPPAAPVTVAAPAESSPVVPILLGGILVTGLYLAFRSQNASQSRNR